VKNYIIVLFFLIIVGCSQQNATEPENTSGNDSTDTTRPPSMSAVIYDKEYKMEAGGFRWEIKQGSTTQVIQTDAASPNQIAEHFEPIVLGENSKVDVVTENNPEITVYLWNEDERVKEITLNNHQIQVPADKGQYIYEVIGKWNNGEASYTFVVEIQ
jgi:hypothetical protein